MNIPYPRDEQIKTASQIICQKALPQKETIFTFIKNMTTHLGLKNIFAGTYDTIAIALFVSLIIGIVAPISIRSSSNVQDELTIFVFAFAPMLFMLMYALSYWKEYGEAVYQIKMTCKYTVHHLLAYRMLVTSFASVLINGIYVTVLCYHLSLPIIAMVSISLSSLFLFSLLLILTVLHFNSLCSVISLSIGWLLVNALIGFLFQREYVAILHAVPVGVWIIVDLALFGIYLNRCTIYLNRRMTYANS